MLVQVCDASSFDAASQTCANPVWVESPGVLPPLSVDDGVAVAVAVITCWCLGYVFKLARKTIGSSL